MAGHGTAAFDRERDRLCGIAVLDLVARAGRDGCRASDSIVAIRLSASHGAVRRIGETIRAGRSETTLTSEGASLPP